jgi:hypothetical protein
MRSIQEQINPVVESLLVVSVHHQCWCASEKSGSTIEFFCVQKCAQLTHAPVSPSAMRGGEYKKCNKSPVINVWDTRAYYIKCGRRKMCILGPRAA